MDHTPKHSLSDGLGEFLASLWLPSFAICPYDAALWFSQGFIRETGVKDTHHMETAQLRHQLRLYFILGGGEGGKIMVM